MYTSVGSWFYKALGGIRLEQIGDNTITIDPSIHGAISAVDAEYATERGYILLSSIFSFSFFSSSFFFFQNVS